MIDGDICEINRYQQHHDFRIAAIHSVELHVSLYVAHLSLTGGHGNALSFGRHVIVEVEAHSMPKEHPDISRL